MKTKNKKELAKKIAETRLARLINSILYEAGMRPKPFYENEQELENLIFQALQKLSDNIISLILYREKFIQKPKNIKL